MKDALKFGLVLLLILIMALICKANEKQFLSTKIMDINHCEIDSITNIKLKNPVIIIGDKVYIAEKRKVYYSVEDYMVYGQYKIDKTIITFYINPDNGEILMVLVKNDFLTYYK